MLSLLAQLAPDAGTNEFWRTPSVYTVADIIVTGTLVVGFLALWVRFIRWKAATSPLFQQVGILMGELQGVKGDIAAIKRDMVEVRHDINAVGETVSSMGEILGTDIVESEERLALKLDKIAEAQLIVMQELSSRPCIVRETEMRERPCPEEKK